MIRVTDHHTFEVVIYHQTAIESRGTLHSEVNLLRIAKIYPEITKWYAQFLESLMVRIDWDDDAVYWYTASDILEAVKNDEWTVKELREN